jgi:hypothetical protein
MSHCSLLKAIRPDTTVSFLPMVMLVMSLSCDTAPPRWSSSTAISAPSLRPARPERFVARLSVDPASQFSTVVFSFFALSLSHSHCHFLTSGDNTPGVAGAPPHPALLTLMLLLLLFRRGFAPLQCPFLDPL